MYGAQYRRHRWQSAGRDWITEQLGFVLRATGRDCFKQDTFTPASDGNECWERIETGADNPDGKTWEVALVMRRASAEDLLTEGMGERKQDGQRCGGGCYGPPPPPPFLLP